MRSITIFVIFTWVRYDAEIISLDALLPASCSAAMAAAAVTPEPVDPFETSRFEAVSFISSIFICRTL